MEQKSAGIRIAPYAVAIVCFILPFMQLSCSGEKMMSLTGVQLVTGSEMKNPMTEDTQKISPDWHAIVALIALAVGIAFCFAVGRPQSIAAGVSGIIALAVMILLKTAADAEIMKEASGFPITVEYKAGFWGVCIASLVGIVLSFMRVRTEQGQQPAAQLQSEGVPSD